MEKLKCLSKASGNDPNCHNHGQFSSLLHPNIPGKMCWPYPTSCNDPRQIYVILSSLFSKTTPYRVMFTPLGFQAKNLDCIVSV